MCGRLMESLVRTRSEIEIGGKDVKTYISVSFSEDVDVDQLRNLVSIARCR